MSGDSLYQRRARVALPLLVRQALVGQEITYSALVDELGMPNPRNINYVLGSVRTTLNELAQRWGKDIPPIQCIAVNQNTGLPGEGFGPEYAKLGAQQKKACIDDFLGQVFAYPEWPEILQELGLPEAEKISPEFVQDVRGTTGHGESEQHLRLKEYIARHPESVGLPKTTASGQTEFRLPSGDLVDVLFTSSGQHTAVKVKSLISDRADLTRGLFQCVKYQAILRAQRNVAGESHECEALLAIEDKFPQELISIRNILGVRVIGSIQIESR